MSILTEVNLARYEQINFNNCLITEIVGTTSLASVAVRLFDCIMLVPKMTVLLPAQIIKQLDRAHRQTDRTHTKRHTHIYS